jgi:hypothetical protein
MNYMVIEASHTIHYYFHDALFAWVTLFVNDYSRRCIVWQDLKMMITEGSLLKRKMCITSTKSLYRSALTLIGF